MGGKAGPLRTTKESRKETKYVSGRQPGPTLRNIKDPDTANLRMGARKRNPGKDQGEGTVSNKGKNLR